jgi:hypothetical protein
MCTGGPFSTTESAHAFFLDVRQRAGLAAAELAVMFELTADDLQRAEAGDDTVWTDRLTPEYHDRLRARFAAKVAVLERAAAADAARADARARVHTLMVEAGAPEGMSVGEAMEAGLLSLDQVHRALHATD